MIFTIPAACQCGDTGERPREIPARCHSCRECRYCPELARADTVTLGTRATREAASSDSLDMDFREAGSPSPILGPVEQIQPALQFAGHEFLKIAHEIPIDVVGVGSFVAAKSILKDLDILLIMDEDFEGERVAVPSQAVFDSVRAKLLFESDVLWARASRSGLLPASLKSCPFRSAANALSNSHAQLRLVADRPRRG